MQYKNNNRMRTTPSGFTLVELIMAVAISAILLATAIPSFSRSIRSNSADAFKSSLHTALKLARSEAVTRGQQVNLCASSSLASCTFHR